MRDLAAQVLSPAVQLLRLEGHLGHVVVVHLYSLVHHLVVRVFNDDHRLLGLVDNHASFLQPDVGFWLVNLSFEHGLLLHLGYTQVLSVDALCLCKRYFASQNGLLHQLDVFLLFVLGLDFTGNDFGHLQSEEPVVDSEQDQNPVVSERAITDAPLFGGHVLAEAASNRHLDFFNFERLVQLLLVDDAPLGRGFVIHVDSHFFGDGEFVLLDVPHELLQSDHVV